MLEKTQRPLSAFNTELKLKGFKIFQIEQDAEVTRTYSRKDFYKICLTTGESRIHYADRSFTHQGTVLFFGNPHVPYSWEALSNTYAGYTCLFSADFLELGERAHSLLHSSLFQFGGTPALQISAEQRTFLNTIFEKMIEEQDQAYTHKADVIRNYISLIIHEALKIKTTAPDGSQERGLNASDNAASRITAVFLELLERQFPIEQPKDPLVLRSPAQFAAELSVHTNYLNKSVKNTTGKPTSHHITQRIISEAKALLQHTNWNISEIAYALGFTYPNYFNDLFKRSTGKTPSDFRGNFKI